MQAKPAMEKLADVFRGTIKVGAINCASNEREQQFCYDLDWDISDLPGFALVVEGEVISFEGSGGHSVPTAKELHEFATQKLPFHLVNNVNSKVHIQDRLLSSKTKYKQAAVLLLSDKYETSSLYASLAYQHRDAYIFGESRAKNINLAKEFGVKKYPMLMTLVPKSDGNFEVIKYNGVVKSEPITEWLNGISLQLGLGSIPPKKKSSSSSRSQRASRR